MRIAMVSTPFVSVPPRGYGGTELFCSMLCDALVARGHSVTLFATGDSECRGELRALYPRANWPPAATTELAHVRWALHELSRSAEPYDAVQINSAVGIRVGAELGIPLVYTLHHERDEALSQIYADHPQVWYVAISRRQMQLEIPLPRMSVIHHGLSPDLYPPSTVDEGYAVHIGRFAPEKGTHLAIEAALAAGTRIVVAGRCHDKPGDKRHYEQHIAPHFGNPRVHYVGEADHPRKLALLRGARSLLCPIRWEEPFGLIAVEAMLVGTPVIGFRRGSFPEIIDEGVTGFLVDDVRQMAEVLRNLRGFDRAACTARARERFSADRLAADYERLFESCMQQRQVRLLGGIQSPVGEPTLAAGA
jgi:glycosyltransferase involved in cell wall biosynthesis